MTSNATSPTTAARTAADLAPAPEPSIGQLVAEATRDVSSLVQNEIALAKSEVRLSVRAGGIGLALIGAATFVLLLAVVMLSVAFAYLIHLSGLDLAWCFLIVFGAYVVIAAGLGLLGWRKFRQVGPPERAIAQAQETKTALMRRG
jgi:hypothetical protein